MKLWEMQRAQDEKERHRQKVAALKAEQKKKAVAENIAAEQVKLMEAQTFTKIGFIITRFAIEQAIWYDEHTQKRLNVCFSTFQKLPQKT